MSTKSLSGKRSVLLKLLYFALVRSILEYGSTIWNPYSKTDIDIIERVQNRFLKFVAFKLNLSIDNNDNTQIGLVSLILPIFQVISPLIFQPTITALLHFFDIQVHVAQTI